MADDLGSNEESWRPVVGFEGYYEVSDLGRIRSLPRVVKMSDGRSYRVPGGIKSVKGRFNGHIQVWLKDKEGKQQYRMVQHLVLEAFVGPKPPKMKAGHIDGDHSNNKLSNLRWERLPEEVRRRRGLSLRGIKRTKEQLANLSASHKVAMNRPEVKEKLRRATLDFWADPNNAERQKAALEATAAGNRKRPTELEKRVIRVLERNYPGMWKYTGDGSFRVGRKFPDFICEERKLIIEAFGTYWHKPEDEKNKEDYYRGFGYKLLVIWSGERVPDYERRIREFVESSTSMEIST